VLVHHDEHFFNAAFRLDADRRNRLLYPRAVPRSCPSSIRSMMTRSRRGLGGPARTHGTASSSRHAPPDAAINGEVPCAVMASVVNRAAVNVVTPTVRQGEALLSLMTQPGGEGGGLLVRRPSCD